MDYLLKNMVIHPDADDRCLQGDLLVQAGRIAAMGPGLAAPPGAQTLDFSGCLAFPGLADVHVHLREPGRPDKETVETGTRAAAAGGFTAVCAMPNVDPVPDCAAHLAVTEDCIARGAVIAVHPYGAISRGEQGEELADLADLAPRVCAFSDDGHGVENTPLMRAAMREARRLGRIVAAHCEDLPLTRGGCIHDGEYARLHGLPGNPSESEWRQVERDLALVRETGCAYHVCHVSTKESVALLRAAQREGLDVTCETAPHYLLLDDTQLRDEGRFRMNPPIRSAADRAALLEGLQDGTVTMIATDHAPHTAPEKAGGLRGSLNGVVGLETAFAVLYTGLVLPGTLPLGRLLERMCAAPRRRFSLGGGRLRAGLAADLTVFDPNRARTVDSARFLSKGRATPFEGRPICGTFRFTYWKGSVAYLG